MYRLPANIYCCNTRRSQNHHLFRAGSPEIFKQRRFAGARLAGYKNVLRTFINKMQRLFELGVYFNFACVHYFNEYRKNLRTASANKNDGLAFFLVKDTRIA